MRRFGGLLVSAAVVFYVWIVVPFNPSPSTRAIITLLAGLIALGFWNKIFNKPLITKSSSKRIQTLIQKKFNQALSKDPQKTEECEDRAGSSYHRPYKLAVTIALSTIAVILFVSVGIRNLFQTQLTRGDTFELSERVYVYLRQDDKSARSLSDEEVNRIKESIKWSSTHGLDLFDARAVVRRDTVAWREHGKSHFEPGISFELTASGKVRANCPEGEQFVLLVVPELGKLAQSSKTTTMMFLEMYPEEAAHTGEPFRLPIGIIHVYESSRKASLMRTRLISQSILVMITLVLSIGALRWIIRY